MHIRFEGSVSGHFMHYFGPGVEMAHYIAGVCDQEKPLISWPNVKRRKGRGVGLVPGSSKDKGRFIRPQPSKVLQFLKNIDLEMYT